MSAAKAIVLLINWHVLDITIVFLEEIICGRFSNRLQ